jgi:hypothetical protein
LFHSYPKRFDAFVESLSSREVLQMMLEHETVADDVDAHFLEILVVEKGSWTV